MDLGLRGARALVVGASAGLGAAVAHQLSSEHAVVVINSRDHDKLQQTASSISGKTSNPVFTHAGDITDEAFVQKLVKNAVSMMGGLDILVTNAGGPPAGGFEKFDNAAWQEATNLTLLSAVNLIRFALPHLKESSRSSVLAIVSMSAKQPVDNLTLSNTIRPAVIGLMKSLSLEHASDTIRFNSILPGWTMTERVDYLVQSRAETNGTDVETELNKITMTIPMQRLGTIEEFGKTAAFLCSPAASFITGVALPVDGGYILATL